MSRQEQQTCSECGKQKERCRAVSVTSDGTIEYTCRQCWWTLDYDKYMHHKSCLCEHCTHMKEKHRWQAIS